MTKHYILLESCWSMAMDAFAKLECFLVFLSPSFFFFLSHSQPKINFPTRFIFLLLEQHTRKKEEDNNKNNNIHQFLVSSYHLFSLSIQQQQYKFLFQCVLSLLFMCRLVQTDLYFSSVYRKLQGPNRIQNKKIKIKKS